MPTPPHRHTPDLLDRAAAACARRGARLTDIRRRVLELVLDSPRPAGAYDMLEQLRPGHKGAAPPTVYRALDFLLGQGLIHKVERLSAYVPCLHAIQDDSSSPAHHHTAQFLICQRCGRVEELDDPAIATALAQAATTAGFRLDGATIEADGLCHACDSAA